MKIDSTTFNAVMANALSAMRREDWLAEAADMVDAGVCKTASEALEGFFAPFCDRLIAASSGIPEDKRQQARDIYFREFTNLALS